LIEDERRCAGFGGEGDDPRSFDHATMLDPSECAEVCNQGENEYQRHPPQEVSRLHKRFLANAPDLR